VGWNYVVQMEVMDKSDAGVDIVAVACHCGLKASSDSFYQEITLRPVIHCVNLHDPFLKNMEKVLGCVTGR
jgi:hypothetical protein